MTLNYLIRKEFLQIRRNAFLPKLILIFPVMIMCVMPWVMNMEVKNIVVDVVDNDRSTQSQQLVHRVEASRYFIFHGQQSSYAAALNDVEKSKADVVLVIPPRYSRDRVAGLRPQVLIAANAVNGTKGALGSSYLSQIVSAEGVSASVVKARAGTGTLYLYNKNLDYKLFMIPSLMAILILMMCGFLPALNIVSEKETGTIEAINVTPVSKWSFILAKLIPYWLIGLFVMTVCFILAWAVYGYTSAGSLALVYLLAVLLALIISGIGLIISNYNDTMNVDYYRIYTWKGWENKDLGDDPLYYNVQGDKSNAELFVVNPLFVFNLKGALGFETSGSYFIRHTRYKYHDDVRANTFEFRAGLIYRF